MRGRLWILLLAWLGWMFDIADTAIFNFAKAPMLIQMMGADRYKVDGPHVESQIQSLFLLGWSLGGLFFGVLADRWGRTRTLIVTVLLYCLCTGLTALCVNPEQVMAARFLTALGIGGEWAAGATLVAEAFADSKRPLASSVLQSAAAFGPMLAALLSFLMARDPWQWLFLVGVAPAAICVLIRAGAHDPKPIESSEKSPIVVLLSDPEMRKRVFASMFVGAAGIAGAGAVAYWQPNLVREASPGMTAIEIARRTSTVGMVSHLGTLAGVIAAPWLCRQLGRKWTIGAFYLLAPCALWLAIGSGASYSRLIAVYPLINLFAIGVSGAFVLYFPELFPFKFRATGAGLAYNVGRVLSIPVPLATGWAISYFHGSTASGLLVSGAVYVVGLAALPFLPETKSWSLDAE